MVLEANIIINVNGRTVFTQRVTKVTKVRPGHYVIETSQLGQWRLQGGKHAGGAANEWYLDEGENDTRRPMTCRSVCEAINLIETM